MRLSPARYPRHVRLLLLTQAVEPSVEVLPALSLLPHAVRILPAQATALLDAPPCDAVLVDAGSDTTGFREKLASAFNCSDGLGI